MNVVYRFCVDGFEGDYCKHSYGISGAGSGYSAHLDYDNMIQYVKLWPYDPIKQGAITLFG